MLISHEAPDLLPISYDFCRALTKSHYENFPVASWIIPKQLRPAIFAIYAFSRLADDFADEEAYSNTRMQRLNEWLTFLTDAAPPTHPVFIALADARARYNLPLNLFSDLLTAFKMDVSKNRYQNIEDVYYYCRHSANPVGRLILHLFGQATQPQLQLADKICTALQLTNFWQDIAIDLKKNRVYLPLDEMDRFDLTVEDLKKQIVSDSFKRLMGLQIERTREIFAQGKPLGLTLSGKLGIEIRLTWLTGMTLLKKIVAVGFNVFEKRPTLSKWDFAKLFFVAISKRRYHHWKG